MAKGPIWTHEKIALLRKLYPVSLTADLELVFGRNVASIYGKAASLGIKKSAEFNESARARKLNGTHGVEFRFQPGNPAWNKGKHYQPGGRCAETQFKKGHLSGRARQLVQPIGALRVTKDGYLERKINNSMPLQRRWKAVHRILWEETHGPIPAGFVVRFKPGMKTARLEEVTLDRLEILSQAENMRRNSYHTNYPKEIAQLIQLRGAVKRKINNRERLNNDTAE